MDKKILLTFTAKGTFLSVDHGYQLFSALSTAVPVVHQSKNIGVKLLRGVYDPQKKLLDISPASKLILLLPKEDVAACLALAGQTLRIGDYSLELDMARVVELRPTPTLYSHLVTTRNGHDDKRFTQEINRQLKEMSITCAWKKGKRKTFKVHDKQIVGHEIFVHGLDARDSLILQENGLGGRRKMGCGIFEPCK